MTTNEDTVVVVRVILMVLGSVFAGLAFGGFVGFALFFTMIALMK